jgi:hypothetical protein
VDVDQDAAGFERWEFGVDEAKAIEAGQLLAVDRAHRISSDVEWPSGGG